MRLLMHCVLIFFAMFNPHSKAAHWHMSHHYELMSDAVSLVNHYSESSAQDLEQFYISQHSVITKDISNHTFLDDYNATFAVISFISFQSLYLGNNVDINLDITLIPQYQMMTSPFVMSSFKFMRT